MLTFGLAALLFANVPTLQPVPTFQTEIEWPQTKAEQTNYAQTSTYAEVIAFVEALKGRLPMTLKFIGKSELGKPIPQIIVHRDPSITPLEAKRKGLLIVYLQANIHAGEVEGKEATLMLLRDWAKQQPAELFDNAVMVVNPIYNSDGNDKFGDALKNRGHQDGPDPVGERANGQGLDLNRDCVKAKSPEMQAALSHVYTRWDPHLTYDLHTTNGTRHGYLLTYSGPLNPTTNTKILEFNRKLLADVRTSTLRNRGYQLFDYGDHDGKRWATFACEPRFVTNYAGLRNRLTILSEAASYQPFKVRVESTYNFVQDTLAYALRERKKIVALCQAADAEVIRWGRNPQEAPPVGVRFELASRGIEQVILEEVNLTNPTPPNKAPLNFVTIDSPIFDRFQAVKFSSFPAGYILPAKYASAARLLVQHGVEIARLKQPWTGGSSIFRVDEFVQARQAFQGIKLIRLEGSFLSEVGNAEKGDYWISTAQPLGRLVFNLLEPESIDGLAAWGFLDLKYEIGSRFPVIRVMAATEK